MVKLKTNITQNIIENQIANIGIDDKPSSHQRNVDSTFNTIIVNFIGYLINAAYASEPEANFSFPRLSKTRVMPTNIEVYYNFIKIETTSKHFQTLTSSRYLINLKNTKLQTSTSM